MADYIPFEVQAEIIKRVPTKSLMQFRSVSKKWKSLIDSSEFIADYSFNQTHQQHLLVSFHEIVYSKRMDVSFVDIKLDNNTFPQETLSSPVPISGHSRLKITASSQGLLCLYCTSGDPIGDVIMIKPLVVWNPSVRKSVVIDVPDVIQRDCYVDIGFGVCPHTKDPKIVKINLKYIVLNSKLVYTPRKFEVYTLRSRVWRSIPGVYQFRHFINLRGGKVVIDGFIHWLAFDVNGSRFQNLIVSFDITNEKFVDISLPMTLACSRYRLVIFKLKESVAVVEVVKEVEKPSYYVVWMMETCVPNTFTKLYTVNLPEASLQICLLGFGTNNEPIFVMRGVDSDSDDLVVNEVNSEDINYIGISWKGFYVSASSYMETILLLDY